MVSNAVTFQRAITPKESAIVPDAHRTEAHIKIAEADPEQTHPCPEHVASIKAADAGVGAVTGWRLCKLIEKSADQMSQANGSQRYSRSSKYTLIASTIVPTPMPNEFLPVAGSTNQSAFQTSNARIKMNTSAR